LSPRLAESVPGPVMMNNDVRCRVSFLFLQKVIVITVSQYFTPASVKFST